MWKMATFKPNKTECLNGKRDRLAVDALLHQVTQYLNLIQVGYVNVKLDDATRVSFASMFLKGIAAS